MDCSIQLLRILDKRIFAARTWSKNQKLRAVCGAGAE